MRRTPQGVAISTMSAEERAQFLQPALSGSTAAKPPTPAAPGIVGLVLKRYWTSAQTLCTFCMYIFSLLAAYTCILHTCSV